MMDIYLLCHRAMQYHGLVPFDDNVIDEDEDDIEEEACQLRWHLQQLSMHMHTSAFLHVWFGENPYGIYGATPTDLIHGIIPCN